jgi:hypothetical protein
MCSERIILILEKGLEPGRGPEMPGRFPAESLGPLKLEPWRHVQSDLTQRADGLQ